MKPLKGEPSNREETIRGYKVKVQYHAMNPEEKAQRQKTASQVILQAMARMKGKQ